MRRVYHVMILAILIQACAGLPFGGALPPTNTPAPIATLPASFTPMDTPTVTITPTITPSPTIVHIPTWDPNQPTATFIPVPIYIGKDTATPLVTPTPLRPGPGFVSLGVSDNKIFWGSCKPNTTKITTQVENPEDVFSVIIFVRVKSAVKEDYTPWTTGNTMQKHSDGTFTYTQAANSTRGHNHYKNSWIEFQLVATNNKGQEIGRTMIYPNAIALSPCM